MILKGSIQIKPRSKERPKLTKSGKAYNTQKTKDAQRQQAFLFRMLAKQACLNEDGTPVQDSEGNLKKFPIHPKTPLAVTIRFYHTGKTNGQPKITVPDIDNLLKLTLDACTNAGIWRDDNQITKLSSEDFWAGSDPSRIEIEIEEHCQEGANQNVQLKMFAG